MYLSKVSFGAELFAARASVTGSTLAPAVHWVTARSLEQDQVQEKDPRTLGDTSSDPPNDRRTRGSIGKLNF